ncbi:unnamed protein product [Spirodela intermedia]|nr:unnamed protein product [Spirodela intermedia]CAA6659947.1 unnamed protein product [Spirodela intermedia]
MVMVNGLEQRFCQQCSRFHMLAEFDEGKRSCRKRLDGHNRRRRKPQPHAMHSANLFANFPGPRFSLYSEVFPAARPESNWVAVVKAEEDVSSLHGHSLPFQFPGSYPRSYEEERAFLFTSNRIMETSVCQPLLPTITTSQGSSDDRMFHGGLAQVLDSELALSLLSSPTCSLGINDSHMVPAGRIPLAQPLFSTFHQHGLAHYTHSQDSNQISSTGFSYPGMVDEQVGGLLVSDAGDADLHF